MQTADWTVLILQLGIFCLVGLVVALMFLWATIRYGPQVLVPAVVFSGLFLPSLAIVLMGFPPVIAYVGVPLLLAMLSAGVSIMAALLYYMRREQHPALRGVMFAWALFLLDWAQAVDPRLASQAPVLLGAVVAMRVVAVVLLVGLPINIIYVGLHRHPRQPAQRPLE